MLRRKMIERLILPDHLPGVDMESGLNRAEGNTHLYRKLLILFYQSNISIVDNIRMALGRQEREEALHLVHAIKGTAGNLGAMELSRTAMALEQAIKGGESTSLDGAMFRFEADLATVFESVRLLEKGDEVPPKVLERLQPLDLSRITQQFTLLETMLKNQDMGARGQWTLLEESLQGHGFHEAIIPLREAIDRLNFSHALVLLTLMVEKFAIPVQGH